MIAPNLQPQRTLRAWLPLLIAGIVIAAVLAGVSAYRGSGVSEMDDYDVVRKVSTLDFRDYWFTARHFRETGAVTTDFGVHNYLPFFTIFMMPWSLLPLPVAAGLFTFVSVGLFGLSLVLIELLLNQTLAPRPRLAVLVTAGLMLVYVVSCAVLGAVDLLVVSLVIITWMLFEQRQEWAAGVPLGLAILIKAVPGVLLIFFLLQRRWRVAGATAAVLLIGGLGVPLASLGWSETWRQHEIYVAGAVQGHSARATILAEAPQKAKYSNNSLPIVLRRLLTETDGRPREGRPGLYVNVVDLPRQAVFWIYLVLMALIVTISMYAGFRTDCAWPPTRATQIARVRTQFGVWCCLMVLAAPLVWTRYLLFALWPLALMADWGDRAGRSGDRFAQRIATVTLLVWLVGAACLAWPAARSAGAQYFSVLVLWAGLVLLAVRPAADD